MAWTAIANRVLGDIFGYQSANVLRDNMVAITSARIVHQLGGSRQQGFFKSSYAEVIDWLEIEIDGTRLSGFTVRAKVEVRTQNASTSVTPKIFNATDVSDAVVGTACTSTSTDYNGTNQKQTLVFTPAAGIKIYKLLIVGGNTSAEIFGIGYVEIFATA